MANSVDPDHVVSDLGLHCLLRSVCLNTYSKYGNCQIEPLRNHPGSTPELRSSYCKMFRIFTVSQLTLRYILNFLANQIT